MKKIGLVLALALVLCLVVASTAFAATYVDWTSQGPNAGTGGPHSGYDTNTAKCAVCHSVHAAPSTYSDPAGTGATKNAELLLRSSAADSCVYCHVTSNIGGIQMFGDYAMYYSGGEHDGEVYGHPEGSSGCVRCHAVHGANTLKDSTTGNNITTKVLKNATATGRMYEAAYMMPAAYSTAMIEGTAPANRGVQITGFCSQCHGNVSPGSETTVLYPRVRNGVPTYNTDGTPRMSGPYKTHPTKSADNPFVTTGTGSTVVNTQVAFLGSNYCRDCHSAGVDGSTTGHTGIQVNNFPHYTENNALFLGNDAGTAVNDPAEDGVCLKCHESGTSGVGQTF